MDRGELTAQKALGTPYTEAMIANARADIEAQARADAEGAGLAGRYAKAPAGNSTAMPRSSPRWMRWSPTCRCWARW